MPFSGVKSGFLRRGRIFILSSIFLVLAFLSWIDLLTALVLLVVFVAVTIVGRILEKKKVIILPASVRVYIIFNHLFFLVVLVGGLILLPGASLPTSTTSGAGTTGTAGPGCTT